LTTTTVKDRLIKSIKSGGGMKKSLVVAWTIVALIVLVGIVYWALKSTGF